MAKSTRGKRKAAPKPDVVDAIVEDVVEVSVDEPVEASTENETSAETVDAEIVTEEVEEAVPDVVEDQEIETDEAEATPDTQPVEKRSNGFIPLVLGGVLAAGVGVVSAQYIFPNGLPFGGAASEKIDLASELKLQAGRIDDLNTALKAQPSVDPSALEAAVAGVDDLQAQLSAVVDTVSGIETRITDLESRPTSGSGGISTAMENELKDLRAALDVQKGTISEMIEDAELKKQSAEETARQTLARAAVTRILVALESGAPFADAIAEVQANSDIAIPDALVQTAADGVPTLAALNETYPDAARAALAAVRGEETGGGVASFFAKQLGARSVAPREGDDPDAILSRVGGALDAGNLSDALAEAEALPDGAKAPFSNWMDQAALRLSAAREAEALANSLNSQ